MIESRIPEGEYFARPELSISQLKELRRSPQHFRWNLAHPKHTSPLSLGKAAHCVTLEPHAFQERFAVWESRTKSDKASPRNGKVWDAFQEAHQGKELLTLAEATAATEVGMAVRADPLAMKYLGSGEPEVVITADIGGRACRGRMDWLTRVDDQPVIVGLKTARDCRPFIFGSAAAKLGYHLQWAWYQNLYAANKAGVRPRMVEIVVESAAPYAVVVYVIPEDVLLQGEEEFIRLLAVLERCETDDAWPGPATHEEPLTLPSWAYTADEDVSDLGLTQ